ncbi:MAG: hypothetical protein L6R39_006421, partial [Caloplaca ligustica]
MSLLAPSRSRYTLAIFLWLSMLFLIWQHYRGLSQLPGRPLDTDLTAMIHQPHPSASELPSEEGESPGTPPPTPPQASNTPATASAIGALISSIEKTSLFFVNESPSPS